MQLLDPAIRAELFCAGAAHPGQGRRQVLHLCRAPTAAAINSLVADGCNIEGIVENSILFPGVVVEAGAVVRNCVLFKETVGPSQRGSFPISSRTRMWKSCRTGP